MRSSKSFSHHREHDTPAPMTGSSSLPALTQASTPNLPDPRSPEKVKLPSVARSMTDAPREGSAGVEPAIEGENQ